MEEALRLVARRGQLLEQGTCPWATREHGRSLPGRQQVDAALETYAQQSHRQGSWP